MAVSSVVGGWRNIVPSIRILRAPSSRETSISSRFIIVGLQRRQITSIIVTHVVGLQGNDVVLWAICHNAGARCNCFLLSLHQVTNHFP